jgi:hypothetical protein
MGSKEGNGSLDECQARYFSHSRLADKSKNLICA